MKAHTIVTSVASIALAFFVAGGVFSQLFMPSTIALEAKGQSIPPEQSHPRLWIVTGGQTGVDRATLDTALALFLPVRGWCPKGRLAEDGIIPPVYPLQETTSTDYAVRTEWNVRDSDGTLILAYGPLEGGTKLTEDLAKRYHRPSLVLNALLFSKNDMTRFWNWVQEYDIRILNVAGPRESAKPGVIYSRARNVLKQLLGL